ncbi:MAG: universal stress protein [Pantoea sp.]|uniref:universal stress protein n=1 Tax=unclassified Pantoea TaxID=2630326 RepID=UPI002394C533|nr:universal stress protein [Pantoea sp.]MDE1187795.1 universal stress protein [Pantoea sp.]
MKSYTHALVLVHDQQDGALLLNHAAVLAQQTGMKITLAHISEDYREMNYVSDSVMDDKVSQDIIRAKSWLSELVKAAPVVVDTCELVTINRFEDVDQCIKQRGIDLVIAGHRNRFMGLLASRSLEYINHLTVDVLIKHTRS